MARDTKWLPLQAQSIYLISQLSGHIQWDQKHPVVPQQPPSPPETHPPRFSQELKLIKVYWTLTM